MKREILIDLGYYIEARLVYYVEEHTEGTCIGLDSVLYGYGKDQQDMSYLLDNKNFRDEMRILIEEYD